MATSVDVKVEAVDAGWKALRKIIGDLAGTPPEVRIGVFLSEKGGDTVTDASGLTNVEKAAVHEYGAPEAGIPERSFIRSTASEHREKYAAMLARLMPRILSGSLPVKDAFDILGAQAVADVQRKVRIDGVPPPLKAETIARKGSSRALIDTGSMLASVTWVVVKGAGAAE